MEKEISMNEANAMQEALNNASTFYIAKSCLIDASVIAAAFNINPDALTNFNGLRIYFGLKYHEAVDQAANNDGTKTLEPFVVAVDDKGNDIIGNVPFNVSLDSQIYDKDDICPPFCPTTTNNLNLNSQIIVANTSI